MFNRVEAAFTGPAFGERIERKFIPQYELWKAHTIVAIFDDFEATIQYSSPGGADVIESNMYDFFSSDNRKPYEIAGRGVHHFEYKSMVDEISLTFAAMRRCSESR